MSNWRVVVRVPVRNLTDEEAEDLASDAVGFLQEYDLWDEAVVESVSEVPDV